jgi:ATP-dependent DNA helicase RecG
VDTPEKLARLQLDKGISSYEDQTPVADPAEITNSLAILGFMYDVVPTAEPEAWLNKQKLIVLGKPVAAGALLFADEPQTLLPKAP